MSISKKAAANLELFKRVKNGDKKARETLIESNLPFVNYVITRKIKIYNKQDREDFFEYGVLGLIKAVDTYKPEKQVAFSVYAFHCISNEIFMFLRRYNKNIGVESLDEPAYCNREDESNASKIDRVLRRDDIFEEVDNSLALEAIKRVVTYKLPEKQALVVNARYFTQMPRTQDVVAEELGISQSYMSRLEHKAIKTIKKELCDDSQ